MLFAEVSVIIMLIIVNGMGMFFLSWMSVALDKQVDIKTWTGVEFYES